jgi:hypothetical protein
LHKKNGILNGLVVPVGRGADARDAASGCEYFTLSIKLLILLSTDPVL